MQAARKYNSEERARSPASSAAIPRCVRLSAAAKNASV
jgi:hypothetical protein